MAKPRITEILVSFTQDNDTCDNSELGQDMDVTAISPDGDGFYYLIETKRWAVDSSAEIADIINRVKHMTEL